MMAVAYKDQTINGILNQVKPGRRSVWTVTRKFKPVKIEPKPSRNAPMTAVVTAVAVCTL